MWMHFASSGDCNEDEIALLRNDVDAIMCPGQRAMQHIASLNIVEENKLRLFYPGIIASKVDRSVPAWSSFVVLCDTSNISTNAVNSVCRAIGKNTTCDRITVIYRDDSTNETKLQATLEPCTMNIMTDIRLHYLKPDDAYDFMRTKLLFVLSRTGEFDPLSVKALENDIPLVVPKNGMVAEMLSSIGFADNCVRINSQTNEIAIEEDVVQLTSVIQRFNRNIKTEFELAATIHLLLQEKFSWSRALQAILRSVSEEPCPYQFITKIEAMPSISTNSPALPPPNFPDETSNPLEVFFFFSDFF